MTVIKKRIYQITKKDFSFHFSLSKSENFEEEMFEKISKILIEISEILIPARIELQMGIREKNGTTVDDFGFELRDAVQVLKITSIYPKKENFDDWIHDDAIESFSARAVINWIKEKLNHFKDQNTDAKSMIELNIKDFVFSVRTISIPRMSLKIKTDSIIGLDEISVDKFGIEYHSKIEKINDFFILMPLDRNLNPASSWFELSDDSVFSLDLNWSLFWDIEFEESKIIYNVLKNSLEGVIGYEAQTNIESLLLLENEINTS